MRPLLRCQVSSRQCESSGSAPGSPTTSRSIASTRPPSSVEPGVLGRPLDRLSQLLLGHRPDERLPALERCGEPRVGGAVAVEVGPQRDDDPARRGSAASSTASMNSAALLLVAAEREHLLELVHDQEVGIARFGKRRERVRRRA